MKKSHIAVILVFMSTGCASVRVGDLGHQRVVLPADPRAPNISIVTESDNKASIVIDQEPIVLPRPSAAAIAGASTSTTTISWALPVFSNYVFDQDKGIVIAPYVENNVTGPSPQNLKCSSPPNMKVYTCTYDTPAGGTKYKYSVMVWDSTKQRSIDRLDPTVWN